MTDPDVWQQGDPYERFMGRWSRRVAPLFLTWLNRPPRLRWLDVGCGTGALTAEILATARPSAVEGVDPSPGFVATAAERLGDAAGFRVGAADALPAPPASVDMVVSGLVLTFVPDPEAALAEMTRVVRPGGTVAGYVWDYAYGMELLSTFWGAAAALDPAAAALDEGRRFPLAEPGPLRSLFASAGLHRVEVAALPILLRFSDFDDYWQPFLGGQGPAPAYAMSLTPGAREQLRTRLDAMLPRRPDGSIELTARAWAVRGAKGA